MRLLPLAALLAVAATVTPAAPVTDATVAARVRDALTRADDLALAIYYDGQADAQAHRIEFHEQLLRAYHQLEGKAYEPLQRQARLLLKAARESRQHFDLLAAAHRARAMADQ